MSWGRGRFACGGDSLQCEHRQTRERRRTKGGGAGSLMGLEEKQINSDSAEVGIRKKFRNVEAGAVRSCRSFFRDDNQKISRTSWFSSS